RFPNGRAIVKALAMESLVDQNNPSMGVIHLLCGHCGRLTYETTTLCYHEQNECGISSDEQLQMWASSLSSSAICSLCGVNNVDSDVEEYLRGQGSLQEIL